MTALDDDHEDRGGVTCEAGWFASEGEQLFGWLHRPTSGSVRGAVVLCQPVFSEYFLSYGTFRAAADLLAGAGLAALRFDYRGTGDSSGEPRDVDDARSWSRDIAAAVTALRRAGAPWVAVVGMRISALLVTPEAAADAAVLWDPVPSGRAFVRAWRLFDRVATDTAGMNPFALMAAAGKVPAGAVAPRPDEPEPAPSEASPSDAPVGFAFPAPFVRSMRSLKVAASVGPAPTLVLTRTGQLPKELAGTGVEVGCAEGQPELLETYPDTVQTPWATLRAVVAWLGGRAPDRPVELAAVLQPSAVLASGALERPVRVGALAGVGLFAVETVPAAGAARPAESGAGVPAPLTCLLLSSGVQQHIGPQRLYVDVARRLAAEGVRSLRIDFSGIGDSPARPGFAANTVYSPGILDDLDDAIGEIGAERLVVVGLCSGGYHALEAAARHPVLGVVAVHAELENGNLEHRPETYSPDRAAFVGYRPWIKAVNRTRLGRAVVWRTPGPVWWLLDRVGLQPDPGVGVQRIVRRGSEVVLVMEEWDMARPRSWPILHRRRWRPTIVPSRAEHSLLRAVDRRAVEELTVEIVRNWQAGRPAGAAPVSSRSIPGSWLEAG